MACVGVTFETIVENEARFQWDIDEGIRGRPCLQRNCATHRNSWVILQQKSFVKRQPSAKPHHWQHTALGTTYGFCIMLMWVRGGGFNFFIKSGGVEQVSAPGLPHLSMLAPSHHRVTASENNRTAGVHSRWTWWQKATLPTDQQLSRLHDKGITSTLILYDAMSPLVATG